MFLQEGIRPKDEYEFIGMKKASERLLLALEGLKVFDIVPV